MASILRVDTLTDASSNNSIATSVLFNGSNKAWINLNGTSTIANRDSYNISGITDNGSCSYSPAFTNNMCNANWSGQISANNGTTDVSGAHDYGFAIVDRATGTYRIDIENASNTQTDLSLTDTIIHGDLA